MGVVLTNRNREHAIQQLRKYLKTEDHIEQETQLNACNANTMIYIGDGIRDLVNAFKDLTSVFKDSSDTSAKIKDYCDTAEFPEDD